VTTPYVHGFEVAHRVDAREGFADHARGFRTGAVDYIVKPFPVDRLRNRVADALAF
jgi:DNA-binding response OmpR family regulator